MPLEALPSKGIIFVLYQGNNNEWNAVYYRYSVHVLVYTYSYDTWYEPGTSYEHVSYVLPRYLVYDTYHSGRYNIFHRTYTYLRGYSKYIVIRT